ncbi:MAG TPA: hypothetical protein VGM03_00515, partial [Phycisphaerae bacterium]
MAAAILGGVPAVHGQVIVYVNAAAAPGGNGASWATAYNNLQTALTTAPIPSQIWVAAGTYLPGLTPFDSFQLRNGVELYGGFSGNETSLDQRDPQDHVTILSGDLPMGFDVCHVVDGSGTDATAVLDGFTIFRGRALGQHVTPAFACPHGSSGFQQGGGVYIDSGSPTIINCTFQQNIA